MEYFANTFHYTVSWRERLFSCIQHMAAFFSIQIQFQLHFLKSTLFKFQIGSSVSTMLQNVTQLRIEWQAFENHIHFTKQLAQELNSRPYVYSGYIN
jgi:hypothetical protein